MGLKQTHQEARRKLRQRLEAEGRAPEDIRRLVEAKRVEQQAIRDAARPAAVVRAMEKQRAKSRERERAREEHRRIEEAERELAERRRQRIEDETYARLSPPDSGYRPSRPDPLLTGVARVTKTTAKAARRSKAMLRDEYLQESS